MTELASTPSPASRFTNVFKVAPGAVRAPAASPLLRADIRSLTGMQKEAVVSGGPGGGAWRLVCDEGPYLNGTDLAPFPLGFFAAGQMFTLLAEILQAVRARGLALRSLSLAQDNRYTMTGSFLRGDAIGTALAPDILLRLDSDAPADALAGALRAAAGRAAGLVLLRAPVPGKFTLVHNGRSVALGGAAPADQAVSDPALAFDNLRPADGGYLADSITRTAEANIMHGVTGGAGSSLQAVQNRTLHVQGEARWIAGRLLQADVGLVQPIGSRFRFHADDPVSEGGLGIAPSPLDHLAAGIGFCFMTQLGRYAHIKKHRVRSYRVAQLSGHGPAPRIETHAFLESEEADAVAEDLLATGERTCFLHAALRAALVPALRAGLNGAPLAL